MEEEERVRDSLFRRCLRHDCKLEGMCSYRVWYFALDVRDGQYAPFPVR